MTAASQTKLRTYKSGWGPTYFQNSTPAAVPSALASYVQAVIGLTNTIRDSMQARRGRAHTSGGRAQHDTSCEAPYPTAAQQFARVNTGTPIPFGYGGARAARA